MIKFKKATQSDYDNVKDICSKLCCLNNHPDCSVFGSCLGGYFINVQDKPKRKRMSKYERLLKALLRQYHVDYDDKPNTLLNDDLFKPDKITDSEMKELIAIKRAMEKKGGRK